MIRISDFYEVDPTILDGIQMPTVLSKVGPPLQKELPLEEFKRMLLARCGQFGTWYRTPDDLKMDVTAWAALHFNKWERQADTLHYDFNPLHNFDRNEENSDTDTNSRTTEGSETGSGKTTNSGQTGGKISGTATDDQTESETGGVAAYNQAAEFSPREKSDRTGKNTTTTGTESTGTSSGNATTESSGTRSETVTETHTNKHDAHMYGNIGVTTTTQMLQEAFEFGKLNVYETMINDFKNEFCIMLYL